MKEYQDYFFKKAKKEGVRSRAFFKLQEIDGRHHLIGRGSVVLDLGCAPGSWLDFTAGRTGKKGKVVGVDKAALEGPFPPWVQVMQEDLFALKSQTLLEAAGGQFDVVLSDAAPPTTGEHFVDQANSLALARRALEIALAVLKPGGHLVLKVFQGPDTKDLTAACRAHFESLQIEKPQSSRKESFEVYLVAMRRRMAV